MCIDVRPSSFMAPLPCFWTLTSAATLDGSDAEPLEDWHCLGLSALLAFPSAHVRGSLSSTTRVGAPASGGTSDDVGLAAASPDGPDPRCRLIVSVLWCRALPYKATHGATQPLAQTRLLLRREGIGI